MADSTNRLPFNGVFYDRNGNKRDLADIIGRGVVDIQKTETVGLIDVYTMFYTDGTFSTFNVVNGSAGSDGVTPHIGENGNWYIGETDTGIVASGPQGGQGLSAYELAVRGGYEGTVTEWLLSLIGPIGPQGIQGLKGDQGDTFKIKETFPSIRDMMASLDAASVILTSAALYMVKEGSASIQFTFVPSSPDTILYDETFCRVYAVDGSTTIVVYLANGSSLMDETPILRGDIELVIRAGNPQSQVFAKGHVNLDEQQADVGIIIAGMDDESYNGLWLLNTFTYESAGTSELVEGDFVSIASNVEDEDNAKVYIRTADSFAFVLDLSGSAGLQGPNGKTAYQVAVENGFDGTELEWLESIKGSDGSDAIISKQTISLLETLWDENNEQTILLAGFDPDTDAIMVSPSPTSIVKYIDCGIYVSAEAIGSITLKTDVIPDEPVDIVIIIGGLS